MLYSNPLLMDIVKKQYFFKIKAYRSVFITMIITQLLGLALSIEENSSSGFSAENYSIVSNEYSSSIIFALMMVWTFITSILLTTKAYRYDDFSFVTNRLSSYISNVFFLITINIIASITSMMVGFTLQLYLYYFTNLKDTHLSPREFFIGLGAYVMYLCLISSLAYLIGMLLQLSRKYILSLIAAFITLIMIMQSFDINIVGSVYEQLYDETSFGIFSLKILSICLFHCLLAFFIQNRMEVRPQ